MIASLSLSRLSQMRLAALLLGTSALPTMLHAQTADPVVDDVASKNMIAFSAENAEYDSNVDIVTAKGKVILSRDGYSLYADSISWDRKSGEVKASGNIKTISPAGDIAYGDSILLTDSLKDGAVENLLLVMADGGRLAAHHAIRTDGKMALDYAAYSPCSVEGPDGCPKNPSWQVKAVKVRYDPATNRVKYDGARIELFGLPVIPLPYLSHPAEVVAATGVLVPEVTITPNNGFGIGLPYYLRLGKNRDATATATLFSNAAPLIRGEYRDLEEKGAFQITGYATYSTRESISSGTGTGVRALRGYIDATGKFQFNQNWSASASVRVSSDRTFLRRYDISRDDRLRSTFDVSRVDNDSYFSIAGWAVQTLRANDSQGLTPIALPEIDYRKRLKKPILGGTLQLQANSLAITRTSGQDTQRAFASAQWDLRRVTRWGQEVNFTLLARGDVYHSSQNADTVTAIYRGESGWQARGIAAAAMDIRWPFVGAALGGTQIFTPRVQIVAAPTTSNQIIPNEDSRAVDLESSNLFALNRFPGYDRFEDKYRVTYGFDWAYRGKDINADMSLGQSYRLIDQTNLFPDGTGLSGKVSDIVGRMEIRYKDLIKLTNRFRLDKDNLGIRTNEIDATMGSRETYAQVGYLRLNRNISTTIEDLKDREEIRLAGRVALARYWSIFGSTIIDLTGVSDDPLSTSSGFEPIRHRIGIAYDDDCLSIGFTWRRDYQPTGDAKRGNSFVFRLAFRNLGV